MMLISQALGGALNGNTGVIKSMMGEITDETNQGTAFSYLLPCWSLGSIIAPAIGGYLSHPAERYPSIFGFEVLRRYPYLLPCLTGSMFSAMGLVGGIFFLEETLPKGSGSAERRPLLASNPQVYSQAPTATTSHHDSDPRHPPSCTDERVSDETEGHVLSAKEIIYNPYIRKILVSYGLAAYETTAIRTVMILWLYTPVKAGGMGFSTAEIGTALLLSGLFGKVVTIFAYPPLERRVGTLFIYRFSMAVQVLNVMVFPVGYMFAIAGGKNRAYLGAYIIIIVQALGTMVFVPNTILIARSAPSKRSRGAINGLAHMFASVSRAIAPGMATSLFAFSAKNKILNGNFVWLVLSLVTASGVVYAYQIPNNRPLDAEAERDS